MQEVAHSITMFESYADDFQTALISIVLSGDYCIVTTRCTCHNADAIADYWGSDLNALLRLIWWWSSIATFERTVVHL